MLRSGRMKSRTALASGSSLSPARQSRTNARCTSSGSVPSASAASRVRNLLVRVDQPPPTVNRIVPTPRPASLLVRDQEPAGTTGRVDHVVVHGGLHDVDDGVDQRPGGEVLTGAGTRVGGPLAQQRLVGVALDVGRAASPVDVPGLEPAADVDARLSASAITRLWACE